MRSQAFDVIAAGAGLPLVYFALQAVSAAPSLMYAVGVVFGGLYMLIRLAVLT